MCLNYIRDHSFEYISSNPRTILMFHFRFYFCLNITRLTYAPIEYNLITIELQYYLMTLKDFNLLQL